MYCEIITAVAISRMRLYCVTRPCAAVLDDVASAEPLHLAAGIACVIIVSFTAAATCSRLRDDDRSVLRVALAPFAFVCSGLNIGLAVRVSNCDAAAAAEVRILGALAVPLAILALLCSAGDGERHAACRCWWRHSHSTEVEPVVARPTSSYPDHLAIRSCLPSSIYLPSI